MKTIKLHDLTTQSYFLIVTIHFPDLQKEGTYLHRIRNWSAFHVYRWEMLVIGTRQHQNKQKERTKFIHDFVFK